MVVVAAVAGITMADIVRAGDAEVATATKVD